MNMYSFTSSLGDFLRPGRIIVWLVVAAFVFLIGRIWLQFASNPDSLVVYGQLTELVVFKVLALASVIFSMMVVGAEVDQKTIVYLLTRAIPRTSLLVSRTLASMVATAIVTGFSWLACGFSVLGGAALQTPGFWWDGLVMLLGVLAYGCLFVFVSLLINKAMIYCLIFAFGWETFVPAMPGDLFYVSVASYLKGLAQHATAQQNSTSFLDRISAPIEQAGASPLFSTIALAGMIIFFGMVMIYWFNHYEYSPREDAD
ncbi:hypothetical protein QPK87_14075 [Kamptonema cortianum]|nr:hypothetical protein [Geitlerinema splendidum]MDK3157695.1 hypothetical protein [Kamptonema cortianum]